MFGYINPRGLCAGVCFHLVHPFVLLFILKSVPCLPTWLVVGGKVHSKAKKWNIVRREGNSFIQILMWRHHVTAGGL